ncbi:MAG: hypothetical protein ACTH3B_12740 [Pseudoalteromonas sp.]
MKTMQSKEDMFKIISGKFGDEKITDLSKISEFFSKLIEVTKSSVIVDFLDATSWDKIEAFDIDQISGVLTLIWHDYRQVDESHEVEEVREMFFPASLYSLGIAIKSIVPITDNEITVFLINGFSKTKKEINSLYKVNGQDFKLYDSSFFEKRVVRKFNNKWEVVSFHCTPIYSLAIIPKNCGLSSFDSKKLLYKYNIQEALNRVTSVVDSLEQTSAAEHDLICEKVNTVRRILEYTLKVECCHSNIKIKEHYSKITLGPLFNYVKKIRGDKFKKAFGTMSELLNEFSHDTGKEINIDKAKAVSMLVMAYVKLLQLDVK